jgi:hypothetical protein
MALGCFTSIAAVVGSAPESIAELVSACREELEHAARKSPKNLDEIVFEKRERLRAAAGSSALMIDSTEIPF